MGSEFLPANGAARASLVLLHGWGCNREVWRPLLAALRGWADVTLVDIPGAAPELDADTPPRLDDALDAIIAQCPPRAVYVGWSLGGQLAVEVAARHPRRVSGVVTLCSNPCFVAADDWPGMEPAAFELFHRIVTAEPATALKRFDLLQVRGSADTRHHAADLRRQRRADGCTAMVAGLEWLRDLDQRATLTGLQQPQLHLHAAADALVPEEVTAALAALLQATANARVQRLDGASHVAPLEAPARLAEYLAAFVAAIDARDTVVEDAAPAIAKRDVAHSFSRAAQRYDTVAGLQRDVGTRLLGSLDEYSGEPRVVLDLGSGTGFFARDLCARFPAARYIGLDIAEGMARYARAHCAGGAQWLVADAEELPLAAESVDLVYSSLALQWCERPRHVFAELARVLRPGGCCVFTSLGPATLGELREAWAAVDAHQHVNRFLPDSALRDAAANLPGLELTLDTRAFHMYYERVRELLDELKTLGAHNMNRERAAGLTGRRALQGMLRAYEARRENGLLPATYEVQFGVLKKA